MAKKYLSLEEAAQTAGLSVEELKQLRERGEIRGFSDGGTWKFKSDDVEELKRSHQADSNPDVPMMTDDELDSDSSIIGMDDEDVSEQPTVIRGQSALDEDEEDAFLVGMSSDSDVQLMPDDLLPEDGGSNIVSMTNSDSDVRLVDSFPTLTDPGSDSDVKLVGGSDSDVQIVGGSDSDVRIREDDSDSDVKLVEDGKTEHEMPTLDEDEDSDSDVALVPPSGNKEAGDMHDTDASVFDDESGISLGDGSSITLAAESGLSLDKIDSDLELKEKAQKAQKAKETGDSELEISTDDSGIALEGFDDSGISLMDDDADDVIGLADDSGIELSPADSGIALESMADSGIALDDSQDRTRPMMSKGGGRKGEDADTAMEMPTLEDDSEFELSMDGVESGDNIIMFDDEDEIDDHSATVVQKRGEPSSEEFDLTGGEEFDLEETFDEFDEDADFGGDEFGEGGFEDELDVMDDVVGEEDELDVFDEGADDFDDDFDTGTSSPDFVGGGVKQGAIAAPVQADWGTGPFVGLLLSTLLMIVCGMMMFDLVRSMWSWNDPSGFNSPLLGFVKDLIK